MASVKVNILKIVDDTGYPTFVEFELIYSNGISHHFIDTGFTCWVVTALPRGSLPKRCGVRNFVWFND